MGATRLLLPPPPPPCAGSQAPDLQEWLEAVELQRQVVVDALVKGYRTIGPLLGKVEEAVAGTNTGAWRGGAALNWRRPPFAPLLLASCRLLWGAGGQ
jgi:hypothetical protein